MPRTSYITLIVTSPKPLKLPPPVVEGGRKAVLITSTPYTT